jgi:hypothetical protein
LKTFLVIVFILAFAFAHASATDQPSIPAKEEISDLLKKADEKVVSFEEAVKNAKPYLDKINPKLTATYLAASSDAHAIIAGMQKRGASAYGLVSLLATLDDLSLNAATASVQLLRTDEEQVAKGLSPNIGALTAVIVLGNASTSCTDISELIMHATLRYVGAEENVLEKLLASQK